MELKNKKLLSPQDISLIVWTLLCLFPIIGMAVDLLAPSLPAISTSLHASNIITKQIVSIYLLGYALGNFFTGFLTDAIGRKVLLRVSLFGFVIVSLLPVFFANIPALLIARFLQGLTIGSTAVISRAIISDVLTSEKLVRLGTVLGTLWGLGPVIGPVLGGYLQFYFGWQAGFWFFSISSLVILIAVFFIIPETHFNRSSLALRVIKNNLTEVLTHRTFMAMVLTMGVLYSLIISFSTLGPFLIQDRFHHSAIFFGHFAFVMGLILLAATFICRYLLKIFSINKMFLIMINVFFLASIIFIPISYFQSESLALVAIVTGFMFFLCGFIFPVAMGKGISLFRHISGTATAVMYLINILMTSLTAFIAGFIKINSAIELVWVYAVLLLLAVIIYWSMIHGKEG